MSEEASTPGSRNAAAWTVAVHGAGGAQVLPLRPDPSLKPADTGRGAEWSGSGELPCFDVPIEDLPRQVLPAGWYEVSGGLDAGEANVASPSLYPRYVNGADGDAQIPLPDPDAGRRVRALLLFKYAVAGLRFSPGRGPLRFRIEPFRLRRVTRLRALLLMLGLVHGDGAGAVGRAMVRGLNFAGSALRSGVSHATDKLYADYRRRQLPVAPSDYAAWVARFDTLTAERMEELRARARRLEASAPLISVLLPTYQTPERLLRRCIDSVLAQVYEKWQLCIADDASPDPKIKEVIEEYARRDPRITVTFRTTNGHISAGSNTALESARGEYLALLDHDDELRPHALLEIADAISTSEDVALIYSDEDKIDEDGRRFDPYFKPDWDPDLLRSQNYLCHLTCIRTELVREVGGFREGFEGSQDHDLFLRCSEKLQVSQIRHIPKVLYHWRAIPGSTALSRDAKDYASAAAVRAVAEHLDRCDHGARVEELSHGHCRVRWLLPEPAPKVSLIVPTRDRVELLRLCIDSILSKTIYPNFEIVVVDNQSSDPETLDYLAQLERHEGVRLMRYDAPFNYSAINNWAVGRCDGSVIGLLNNDVEVISPGWLEEMVSHALRPDVGAVGAMLYYPNDSIQHAGVVLGVHGVAAHIYAGMPRGYPGHGGRARVTQSLSAVTGACLLVQRSRYEQVDGLDEVLEVAFNDVDFCLRLRAAGYRNVWTPFAELYHHESASRGSEDTDCKKRRFAGEVERMVERWGSLLLVDPAYNPNLSLTSRCSELAIPPR